VQIVPDNYLYARVALVVKDKGTLSEEKLPELAEVLADEAKAKEVRLGLAGAVQLCGAWVCCRAMRCSSCVGGQATVGMRSFGSRCIPEAGQGAKQRYLK
jgi:hypothetical protein